jgi:DtxR family Mn-dependent transcriptional regulator
MSPHGASPVAQDYLKAIWTAREWTAEDAPSTKSLAARMGVSPSTASEAVKRLADQGLVVHEPYRPVELTAAGRRIALAMVRRHRLLETFLVSALGYGWDEAHDDAEVLEHAASEQLICRIDAHLGHPVRDPHGDPIPAADGTVAHPPAVPLATLEAGQRGHVARFSDANPEMLRYFAATGLALDTPVEVTERRDFAGVIVILLPSSGATLDLGTVAAEAIWVVRA